ncbi:hypothetical protein LCGC14_2876150 [marine sediment metagenome]|uniref:Uncharacterized protein n=1 Tax=marine sediment metagenome TaxID=412755 RepID=A0A0F9ASN3_9ZZZZ
MTPQDALHEIYELCEMRRTVSVAKFRQRLPNTTGESIGLTRLFAREIERLARTGLASD